nr:RNA polymerase subunit sigma [Lysinibacillus timonensis]
MSLKAVELQIAIPKTLDAGKIADQHQQNVIQQQHFANEAVKKESERKQVTVNETGSSEKISEDKNGQNNKNGSDANHHDNQQKSQSLQEVEHPYKGHFFDFSG